jgi:hypothetical protein
MEMLRHPVALNNHSADSPSIHTPGVRTVITPGEYIPLLSNSDVSMLTDDVTFIVPAEGPITPPDERYARNFGRNEASMSVAALTLLPQVVVIT